MEQMKKSPFPFLFASYIILTATQFQPFEDAKHNVLGDSLFLLVVTSDEDKEFRANV